MFVFASDQTSEGATMKMERLREIRGEESRAWTNMPQLSSSSFIAAPAACNPFPKIVDCNLSPNKLKLRFRSILDGEFCRCCRRTYSDIGGASEAWLCDFAQEMENPIAFGIWVFLLCPSPCDQNVHLKPKWIQRMTFESYLYEKLANGNRWEDLKMVSNTIGSLIWCKFVGKEVQAFDPRLLARFV